MTIVHRHNPLLKNKLLQLSEAADADKLQGCLSALSATDFRTAGFLLANEVLPSLQNEQFWPLFFYIVPTNSKAFLGTFLKGASALYRSGRLQLPGASLKLFAEKCTAIDTRKCLETLLPLLKTTQEVAVLCSAFFGNNMQQSIPFLMKAHTIPSFYQLFLLLKMSEPEEVEQSAQALLRMGDELSLKMASVLKHYFALDNISALYALRIEVYELSRLDNGYEFFHKMLTK